MSEKAPAGTAHSLPGGGGSNRDGKNVRTSKNRKAKSKTQTSEDAQRKIEMEKKIRKRVSLEEKAFRLVGQLLENPITEEFLTEAGNHLTPEHYHDVVEERSISSTCGYPICPKPLNNVLKQKYHISSASNKVYDITDRKKFCSNQCYKASQYFEKQISDTPVWAREVADLDPIQLLSMETGRGVIGETVITSPGQEIKQELEELDRLDKRRAPQKPRASAQNTPDTPTSGRMDSSLLLSCEGHKVGTVQSEGGPTSSSMDDTCTSEISNEISKLQIKLDEDSRNRDDSESVLLDDLAKTIAEVCIGEAEHERALYTELQHPPSEGQRHSEKDDHNGTSSEKDLTEIARDVPQEQKHSDYFDDTTMMDKVELFSSRSVKSQSPVEKFPDQSMEQATSVAETTIDERSGSQEHDPDICDKHLNEVGELQPTGSPVLSACDTLDVNKLQGVFVTEVDPDFELRQVERSQHSEFEDVKQKTVEELKSAIKAGISSSSENCASTSDRVSSVDLSESNLEGLKSKQAAMNTTKQKSQLLMELLDRKEALLHQSKAVVSSADSSRKSPGAEISQNSSLECPKKSEHQDSTPRHKLVAYIDDYSLPGTEKVVKQSSPDAKLCTGSGVIGKAEKPAKKATSTSNIDKKSKLPSSRKPSTVADEKLAASAKKRSKKLKITALDLMKRTLLDWKTSKTVKFLKVSDKSKKYPDNSFDAKYAELCRQVDAQDMSNLIDEDTMSEELGKGRLPSMQELEKDAMDFEYRVKEFYRKPVREEEQTKSSGQGAHSSKSEIPQKIQETPERDIVLPPVDSLAPVTHRRKIVLDKLSRVFPELLGPLRIPIADISGQLKQLVKTFNLTSTNILLKPAEWTLMAYFLLRLLSVVNSSLNTTLHADLSTHYFRAMLLSLNISESEVTKVIDTVCSDIGTD